MRASRPLAIVFLLLSVAAHVGVLRASRTQPAKEPPTQAPVVAVRILPATPVALAIEPVTSAPPKARPSARPPKRQTAPKRPVRAAPKRPSPAKTPRIERPTTPPYSEPTVELPQAVDTVDVASALAAPHDGPPAASLPGDARPAQTPSDPVPAPEAPSLVTAQPAVPFAAPAAPATVQVPTRSGSARYRVYYGDPADGNVVATLDQSFDLGAEHYRLRSEGRALGVMSWFYRGALVQESSGIVSSVGLQPSLYRERRGDRPMKESSIDPVRGVAVFPSGASGEAPQGVQDRLSIFVQLALLLHSFPDKFAAGATIELPVLASSRVESASWQVIGREPVTTAAGDDPALHLRRAPTDEEDPTIDLWLALDARVLPLRMRATESSGRVLDQLIEAP